MTQQTTGVKRLHILRDAQGTIIVVFSQFPAMTAAARRKVLTAARQSGLLEPIQLIATCPIQAPQVLQQLGLPALQPFVTGGVTFVPMPDGKPAGGFLEIGDCAPGEDTYPWEGNVELLLGSNGRVYALVEENSDALPTLDEAGHAVEDNPASPPEPHHV
jgi:hypothetical protein